MKYSVGIYRQQVDDVVVFADNYHDAIEKALNGRDGFLADSVTELLDEDKEGDSSDVVGRCEVCEVYLLDGDEHMSDVEGVPFCRKCYDELLSEVAD